MHMIAELSIYLSKNAYKIKKSAFQSDSTKICKFSRNVLFVKLRTLQKQSLIETFLSAGLEGFYQLECVSISDWGICNLRIEGLKSVCSISHPCGVWKV